MDLFVTMMIAIEVLCAFGFVFIICELGERFTAKYDDISVVINQFNWYLFPTEVKRILPITILSAQQPVTIDCFGSFMCVRTTFKSVSAVKI